MFPSPAGYEWYNGMAASVPPAGLHLAFQCSIFILEPEGINSSWTLRSRCNLCSSLSMISDSHECKSLRIDDGFCEHAMDSTRVISVEHVSFGASCWEVFRLPGFTGHATLFSDSSGRQDRSRPVERWSSACSTRFNASSNVNPLPIVPSGQKVELLASENNPSQGATGKHPL